jgi:hypothetical protein
MQFTLVYRGDLPPNGDADQKWDIRRKLEPQLRMLCSTPPFDALKRRQDPKEPAMIYIGKKLNGIDYIPVISTKHGVRAQLDILSLSSELPGGALNCGDIDNRMKTLFDALSAPANKQQVPQNPDTEPDRRVYCLLEDDRLVTSVKVENERLLDVPPGDRDALVIIRVRPTIYMQNTVSLSIAT